MYSDDALKHAVIVRWIRQDLSTILRPVYTKRQWLIGAWASMLLLPPANEVGKGYVFTRVCQSFCSQGVLPQCMLGYPQRADPPQKQTSPRAGTHPPLGAGTPPGSRPSRSRHPARRRACWEIQSTRGRYASYWNAILSYPEIDSTKTFIGKQ